MLGERFWSKVAENAETGCWEWTASRFTGTGYGMFKVSPGIVRKSHRLAYEEMVGPIPDGLQLDHRCRVRHCVNPDHLEPVTCQENLRRGNSLSGQRSRQADCLRGHPLAGANLQIDRLGRRVCRECVRIRSAARVARRRDLRTP